jgi:hypothetical protein
MNILDFPEEKNDENARMVYDKVFEYAKYSLD